MILRLVIWFLDRCFERFNIGRNWGNDLYLVRWTILGRRFCPGRGKLFLHWFHRSDYDHLHDHPWPYWSLILWGGYFEETQYWDADENGLICGIRSRWKWPGFLLRRPAEWRHRVVLPEGRRCWSLVWTGPKVREWGFWCPSGWREWSEHERVMQQTGDGCAEV